MTEEKNSQANHKRRTKALKRALFWGVISLSIYLAVFLNQDTITRHFTKGGVFALVIIVTALAVSLIHGSFANYTIEISGIKPYQDGKHQEGVH
jgi:peptidoglycan/LPS O-acetylase OafA/YrhL